MDINSKSPEELLVIHCVECGQEFYFFLREISHVLPVDVQHSVQLHKCCYL